MRLAALIPAYNEEGTIGELVEKTRRFAEEVVVVDDGSDDETGRRAREAGARTLSSATNCGKGSALRKGLEYLRRQQFDAVILLDADGQHNPEEIPLFLRKMEDTSAGVVVGNRMDEPQAMPLIRRLTNRFMSALLSSFLHRRIPDTQCGFRLLSREVLNRISLSAKRYDIESEMLLEAGRAGFKIESVAVRSIYSGQKSCIAPFPDTLRFVRLLIERILKGRGTPYG